MSVQAFKTPEQNERESGIAQHERSVPEPPPLQTSRETKLLMLLACEGDPVKQAELTLQLETERARGAARPPAPTVPEQPTRMAQVSFPRPPHGGAEPLSGPISAPPTTSSMSLRSPERPNQPDP